MKRYICHDQNISQRANNLIKICFILIISLIILVIAQARMNQQSKKIMAQTEVVALYTRELHVLYQEQLNCLTSAYESYVGALNGYDDLFMKYEEKIIEFNERSEKIGFLNAKIRKHIEQGE